MAASTTTPDAFECRFCEVSRPTVGQMRSHLIGNHAEVIAAKHCAAYVDAPGEDRRTWGPDR